MRQLLQKYLTVRLLKSVSAGIVMGAFNAGVFFVLVGVAGLTPLLTNLLRASVTMQLRFVIARHYTWRDRRDVPAWIQWRRHMAQKAVGFIFKQLVFALLILISLHYIVAYFACAALMGILNSVVADKYVFRAKAVA